MSGERSTTRAAGGAAGGCRATADVHITNPVTAMISDTRAHAPMFIDASLEPYSRRRVLGAARPLGEPGQARKGGEHLGVRKIRVPAAWIGEHEYACAFQRFALQADAHRLAHRPF